MTGAEPVPGDLFLEPGHIELGERVDAFVRDRLEPAAIDEEAPDAPRRALDLLADGGFLEHIVPKAYGGAAERLDLRSICVIRERLARGSGLADTMFVMQGLGSHLLLLGGSEALRAEHLPQLPTGKHAAAIAITEMEAGSDLGSISTAARRDGDEYVLDGAKSYISNAGFATFYTVLARTGAPEDGRRGLSCFLVEADRPGLQVEPQRLLSPHPIGRVRFQGCRIPEGHRLADEGDGFRLAVQTLNFFRPSVGAAANGFAYRALEETRNRVRKRVQFGRPLAEFQGVQHILADMATGTDAARLMVQQAAAAHDSGSGRRELASMAKLFATENAGRVADSAVQLHGAAGLVAGSIVERLYRQVRGLRIYEGTSEIQRNLIAKEILRGSS